MFSLKTLHPGGIRTRIFCSRGGRHAFLASFRAVYTKHEFVSCDIARQDCKKSYRCRSMLCDIARQDFKKSYRCCSMSHDTVRHRATGFQKSYRCRSMSRDTAQHHATPLDRIAKNHVGSSMSRDVAQHCSCKYSFKSNNTP
jgi:hypothetical protein